MIERSESGSISLTYGSGSGSRRPKNMWIRWIRIRISNTAHDRKATKKQNPTAPTLFVILCLGKKNLRFSS
jgi:hypothetical protein